MTFRLARPGEVTHWQIDWQIDGPCDFDVVAVVQDDADHKTRVAAFFVGAIGTPVATANAQTFIRASELLAAHAPVASRRQRR